MPEPLGCIFISDPGYCENAYQACLEHELRLRGLDVKSQVYLPVEYKGIKVKLAYKMDMLINDSVIVELTACAGLDPICKAHLLPYLRLSQKEVGLIINFHNFKLTEGIVRIVNGYPTTKPTAPLPAACS